MKKRDANLDLIRSVAVLSVISIHSFLNNGFYYEPVQGSSMFWGCVLRSMSMICVPLFLMLTGYLMSTSKVDWNRLSEEAEGNVFRMAYQLYKGLGKTLGTYFLCNTVILCYIMLAKKELLSPYQIVTNYTSFDQYAWYIEMYIGLYLLIPFLNLIYQGVPNEKAKKVLLAVLILLTTAPSLINSFDLSSRTGLIHPSMSQHTSILIPDWWISLYPVTYYFLGAYIREKREKIKDGIGKNALLLIAAMLLFGVYCWYRSIGTCFVDGKWCDWGGYINMIDTVLIFLLLLRIPMDGAPKALKWVLEWISKLSLGMYLLSWIFDQRYYSRLNSAVAVVPERIAYYPLMVLAVFGTSAMLSLAVYHIQKWIVLAWRTIRGNGKRS